MGGAGIRKGLTEWKALRVQVNIVYIISQKNYHPTMTMFRVDSLFQHITASGTPTLGLLLSKGRFYVQFIYLSMHASITSKRKQGENKHRCIKRGRKKDNLY